MVWPRSQLGRYSQPKVAVSAGLEEGEGDADDDMDLASQELSQGLYETYLMLTATLEGDAGAITILKMRTLCPGGSVTSPVLSAGKGRSLVLNWRAGRADARPPTFPSPAL